MQRKIDRSARAGSQSRDISRHLLFGECFPETHTPPWPKDRVIRETRLSKVRQKMDEFRAMLGEKGKNILDNYHSRSMKVTCAATECCTYVGIIGPRHAILKSTTWRQPAPYLPSYLPGFVNAARSTRCLTR